MEEEEGRIEGITGTQRISAVAHDIVALTGSIGRQVPQTMRKLEPLQLLVLS